MNPEERLSDLFPRLSNLGDVPLGDPGFIELTRSREESILWSRLPTISRAHSLKSLLEHRLRTVAAWAGIGPKMLANLLEMLEWLDHIVGDTAVLPDLAIDVVRARGMAFAANEEYRKPLPQFDPLPAKLDNAGSDLGPTLLRMFPGLEAVRWAGFTYWKVGRAAATQADRDGLKLIKGRSNVRSLAKLLSMREADVRQWPGVGDDEFGLVLTYLRSLELYVLAGEVATARAPSSGVTQTVPTSGARPLSGVLENDGPRPRAKSDQVDDPMTGLLGDVFPHLWFLADVDLRSPWLDQFTTDRGRKEALRYIRRGPRVPTIGDLLRLNTDTIVHWQGVGPVRRGQILDFLAHVGAEAYESRQQAIHVVSSWVGSTRGRATWANLLAAAADPKPVEVQQAWSQFVETPITESPTRTASRVIVDYLAGLEDLDRTVLIEHCMAGQSRSLESIADEFVTTATNVRRRAQVLESEVRSHVAKTDTWLPVAWAVEAREAGISAPVGEAPNGVGRSDAEVASQFVDWLCASEGFPVVGRAEELVQGLKIVERGGLAAVGVPVELGDPYETSVSGTLDAGANPVLASVADVATATDSSGYLDAIASAEAFLESLDARTMMILSERIVHEGRLTYAEIGAHFKISARAVDAIERGVSADLRLNFELSPVWASIRSYCRDVEALREPSPPEGTHGSTTVSPEQFLGWLCGRVTDGDLNPGTDGPF